MYVQCMIYLGGAYMCIYPMYSPGGYQLIGRTLPIWNTWGRTHGNKALDSFFSPSKPWMLEMFDQIRFYEVPETELNTLRQDFRDGKFCPKFYNVDFDLADYDSLLQNNKDAIQTYMAQQQRAMDVLNLEDKESLERLAQSENTESSNNNDNALQDTDDDLSSRVNAYIESESKSLSMSTSLRAVTADVSSRVYELSVKEGDIVEAGVTLLATLEAMKIEIPVYAETSGEVAKLFCSVGDMREIGDCLLLIREETSSLESERIVHDRQQEFRGVSPDSDECTDIVDGDMCMSTLRELYVSKEITPRKLILQIYQYMDDVDKEKNTKNYGNIWITRYTKEEVLQYVYDHFERENSQFINKESLAPLYGIPFAVKDNFNVRQLETTCACPAFAYVATETATCVQKLLDAGAILIGKTNMDQFATGLVGTRSPYGECYNSIDEEFISGGSSSGEKKI